MSDRYVEILKLICDFAGQIEAATQSLKQRISELVLSEEIKPPAPVALDDRAIQWLLKRLEDVKQKHPDFSYTLVKDGNMLVSLKFSAPTPEIRDDVVKPASWAFQVAAERPSK